MRGGGLLLDFRPQRSRAPIHQARPPGDPASNPDPASPGRMLAPYAGVLYSAPLSGPDPHPWDPARLLRLRQPPRPPQTPRRAGPHPCSSACGRFPSRSRRSSPGSPWRRLNQAHRRDRLQRLRELRPVGGCRSACAGSPPRTASACARSTWMQTPGRRRRAQCQMQLVPPARPAGLERGGGWAGPGRGQAGGGEARRRCAGAGRGRPKGTVPRWTPHCGSQHSRLRWCKEKALS